jgi:LmbE family N-acetylglucosaminyl deacetylase
MTPTHSGLLQLARDLSIYPIPPTWNAIPHPRPCLNHYSKEEARQRLGWGNDDLYFIAVGRFAPLKQFPALIQAVADLPTTPHSPPWKLVLIGEGDRAPLQTLANELGIVDHLLFAISDDMGLYYSAADVYVSTSLTESFGLANLEAVVMGLPAICTAVGGVPEVVGSGACLIPAQDNRALRHVLRTFLEEITVRVHWLQQAQHWVQGWPDASDIAERYIAMYQGQPLSDSSPPSTSPTFRLSPFPNWQRHVNSWSLCPLPRPLELPKHAKILLIAPHPDDETLGCGGTLALLRQHDCQIKVVIVADGKQGDPQGYLPPETDIVTHRQQESRTAMRLLGIEDVTFLGHPDGNVQHSSELFKQLLDILHGESADWLFIPSVLDYHRDHVAISLVAVEAWQQHGCRERLFLYETWAPVPATWVVDISSVFALKQQATQCYALPLKYCDYLTACTGMANYRGLYLVEESQGQSAEAFLELTADTWEEVLRNVWKVREFQEQRLRS